MIAQNLGMNERMLRLLLGLGSGAWAMLQPALGAVEILALVAASFLVLNGVFGRCYLWALLDVNTDERRDESCGRRASGR